MDSKKFALIGASGYVARKHVEAIYQTGNELVSMLDPHDNVGYIDPYFPEASYFKETERFDRHLFRLQSKGTPVDYVSICSPNYLHDSHIRLALRNGCNVICEKPVVLKHEHLLQLQELESLTDKKVNVILQLRLHPEIIKLKEQMDRYEGPPLRVTLMYYTPRGKWYDYSWKGDIDKSGGVSTNIGIHLFDLLIYLFGNISPEPNTRNYGSTHRTFIGNLNFEKALVNITLSTNPVDVAEMTPVRYLEIGKRGDRFEFSNMQDLHVLSYTEILEGRGFTLEDAKPAIKLVEELR